MTTKTCKTCNRILLLDSEHFYKDKSKPTGFYPKCKQCAQAYERTPKRKATIRRREHSKHYRAVDRISAYKRIAKRASNALCRKCGKNPPLPFMNGKTQFRLCELCYLKRKATQHLGSSKHWQALQAKLVSQNYQCAYTGTPLVLGLNDSVDHIYPKFKYPDRRNSLDNIEWVTREMNKIKFGYTPKEILAYFQNVLNYRLHKGENR